MQKKLGRTLALLLVCLVLVITISCQKKSVAIDTGTNSTGQTAGSDTSTADQSDTGEATLHSTTAAAAAAENNGDSGNVLQESIFFEYDKATLTPAARETLASNGEWLRLNADIVITIEGHCDKRGTNGYNLALGDRRAESVRTFLVDLGVDSSRLTTVSYGEERPLDRGNGESAWAKNRRAHFLIR